MIMVMRRSLGFDQPKSCGGCRCGLGCGGRNYCVRRVRWPWCWRLLVAVVMVVVVKRDIGAWL